MLVPLLLWQWHLVRYPHFHISAYLEGDRDGYYEALLSVSRDRDWTTWVRFFLTAVRTHAEEDLTKIEDILALHEDLMWRLPEITRSRHAVAALDRLFLQPVFTRTGFARRAGIPEHAAGRLLMKLRADGVVEVPRAASGRRAALLVLTELLDVAEGRAEG